MELEERVKMEVQGYLELDYTPMSEEQYGEFLSFLGKYFINFKRIKIVDKREYYSVIIKDVNMLYDSENEEGETTSGLLTIMSPRNLKVNGMWDIDGIPYGKTEVTIDAEYDSEDNEIKPQEINFEGTATYPIDLKIHLKYSSNIVKYDEEGIEISRVKETEFKPLHQFGGWDLVSYY